MYLLSPSELLAFAQEHGFLTSLQVQELTEGAGTRFADGRAQSQAIATAVAALQALPGNRGLKMI